MAPKTIEYYLREVPAPQMRSPDLAARLAAQHDQLARARSQAMQTTYLIIPS